MKIKGISILTEVESPRRNKVITIKFINLFKPEASVLITVKRRKIKGETESDNKRKQLLLTIECLMFSEKTMLERVVAVQKEVLNETNKYHTSLAPLNYVCQCRSRVFEPNTRFIFQVYLKDLNSDQSMIAFSKQFIVHRYFTVENTRRVLKKSKRSRDASKVSRNLNFRTVRYKLIERKPVEYQF